MTTETKWNKAKLAKEVAEQTGMTHTAAHRAVDATLDAITRALTDGHSVPLIGFGTFSVKERAARTGRNPRTGEEIQIRACKVPTFKAGKKFKETVQ